MTDITKSIPEGHQTVTPYLIVSDASGLLSFMERAFGGEILMRHQEPNGRITHAEVQIGDSRVMVGEATGEWPPTRAMLHLFVDDVDRWFQQALDAGARSVREPEDMFYGDRSGGVEDAFGNQWWMATHIEDVTPEEIERRGRERAAQAQSGD